MPRRRPHGHVFRRVSKRGGPGENDVYRAGWYLRVREKGKEVVRFAGLTRETAVEVANKLAHAADRRDLLDEPIVSELRFEEFAKEYLRNAERVQTPATYDSRRRMVEAILVPYFRGRVLAEIRAPDLQRLLESRKGVVSTTRNRLLTGISSMFRRAMELGYVQSNPARDVRRLKETRVAIPLVDLDDQDRLIEALAEPMRSFFLTLIETGVRLGELLRLEWRDVDVQTGKIVLRTTKAKRPRILSMSSRLLALLGDRLRSRTRPMKGPDFVFPGAMGLDGNLNWLYRRALPAAVKAVNLPHIRIHDLRHLHAINLVRAGTDLPTVQNVLGHTSLISTLRYAEYSDGSASVRVAQTLDRLRAEVEERKRKAASPNG